MAAGSLTGGFMIRRYVNPTILLVTSLITLSICYGILWLDVTGMSYNQAVTLGSLYNQILPIHGNGLFSL